MPPIAAAPIAAADDEAAGFDLITDPDRVADLGALLDEGEGDESELDLTGEPVEDDEQAAVGPSPAAPAGPAAVPVPGLDHARGLIRARRHTEAIRVLRKLEGEHPTSAEIPYLLGNVYFERLWWSDGFEAYRAAIRIDPSYREDPRVIGDAIRSLQSRSQSWRGARFLERDIGAPAIPQLRKAAKSNSLGIRRHALRLLAQLEPRASAAR
jgi:tetratricopeptide (TPR) repeat protein